MSYSEQIGYVKRERYSPGPMDERTIWRLCNLQQQNSFILLEFRAKLLNFQIKKLTESKFDSEATSEEETFEDWSQDQVRKRSQELQLIDDHGKCISPKLDNGRRSASDNRTDENTNTELDDGSKSASTTSDSQVGGVFRGRESSFSIF